MKPVAVSITVPRPREEIYSFLDTLANHERFTDHMLVDWRVVGTCTRSRRERADAGKKRGRADWLDLQVVAADPPHVSTEESVSAGGRRRTRGAYILDELPDGEGTNVSFRFEWLQAPLSERLAAPLTRAVMRRGNARSLRRLAEQLNDGSE